MRITNGMTVRATLAGLESNRAAINRLQSQIASGIALTRPSDDPAAASTVMRSTSALAALGQYQRNVATATARNSLEGSTLDHVTGMLGRAREIAVSQATGTASEATRRVAAAEMEQIFHTVVSLGGTRFGDEYLYGGDTPGTVPFTATGTGASLDFTTSTPSGTRRVAIAENQSIVATHDGQELFADTGVLASLRDATRALAGGDQAAVRGSLPALEAAFARVQTLHGEQGARANALDVAAQNLTALEMNLTVHRSQLQDVDIETAVTELVAKQNSYQAAMLASSKLLGMTLTDYLR